MPWQSEIVPKEKEYKFFVKDFKYPEMILQEIIINAFSRREAIGILCYRYKLPKRCYWEFKGKRYDSRFRIIIK